MSRARCEPSTHHAHGGRREFDSSWPRKPRSPTARAAFARCALPLPGSPPSSAPAPRTGCSPVLRRSSHAGIEAQTALFLIDRIELPQLAHDPFELAAIASLLGLAALTHQGLGFRRIGRALDLGSGVVERAAPGLRITEIGRQADANHRAQLAFDLARAPTTERAFDEVHAL